MKELKIDIDDKTLNFLLYLVSIKRYDGLSLWRVLHKPKHINSVYNDYLKKEEKNGSSKKKLNT